MTRPEAGVAVIGAGLAGLTAALRLARAGRRVTLVAKGAGGLGLSQGTVDVVGYAPDRVDRPLDALAALPPEHPYVRLGAEQVEVAVAWLRDELGPELLVGDPAKNVHLPTAIGSIRPTALAQPSMLAGQVSGERRYAVLGVRQLKDFNAELVAGNLARSTAPDGGRIGARAAWIDLPARAGEADSSALTYARALDDHDFAVRFADNASVAMHRLGECDAVLLPAVLGLRRAGLHAELSEQLGVPVAEVPLPPPSVPGLRLAEALLTRATSAGVRVVLGSEVVDFRAADRQITDLTYAAAGGPRTLRCAAVVYAPGGFESGALRVDSHAAITERLFDLPLTAQDASGMIVSDYAAEQPLFAVGVRTDTAMRPVTEDGQVVHENLFAVGGLLAGAQRWREKSGDGIAVASAVRAADAIIEGGAR